MNIRNFLSSSYNVNKNDLIARVKKILFVFMKTIFKKMGFPSILER